MPSQKHREQRETEKRTHRDESKLQWRWIHPRDGERSLLAPGTSRTGDASAPAPELRTDGNRYAGISRAALEVRQIQGSDRARDRRSCQQDTDSRTAQISDFCEEQFVDREDKTETISLGR
eukprot:scaffold2234_cov211-Pinguiococcus_pyrenoidosus.AAC.3